MQLTHSFHTKSLSQITTTLTNHSEFDIFNFSCLHRDIYNCDIWLYTMIQLGWVHFGGNGLQLVHFKRFSEILEWYATASLGWRGSGLCETGNWWINFYFKKENVNTILIEKIVILFLNVKFLFSTQQNLIHLKISLDKV